MTSLHTERLFFLHLSFLTVHFYWCRASCDKTALLGDGGWLVCTRGDNEILLPTGTIAGTQANSSAPALILEINMTFVWLSHSQRFKSCFHVYTLFSSKCILHEENTSSRLHLSTASSPSAEVCGEQRKACCMWQPCDKFIKSVCPHSPSMDFQWQGRCQWVRRMIGFKSLGWHGHDIAVPHSSLCQPTLNVFSSNLTAQIPNVGIKSWDMKRASACWVTLPFIVRWSA